MRTTAQLYEDNLKNPRYETHLKRSSGTKEALKNITIPSDKDIEEMVTKAQKDAEMDLRRLGVAVDCEKCFEFDSKLMIKIIDNKEEEIIDDCEKRRNSLTNLGARSELSALVRNMSGIKLTHVKNKKERAPAHAQVHFLKQIWR